MAEQESIATFFFLKYIHEVVNGLEQQKESMRYQFSLK
jgi:hypothetical protein